MRMITSLIVLFLVATASLAQTADDVVCARCVDGTDLAPQSVSRGKLQNGAVSVSKLALGAVDTSRIRNGAVTADKLSSAVSAQLAAPRMRVIDAADVEQPVIYYGSADGNDSGTYVYDTGQGEVGVAVRLGPTYIGTEVWYDALDCLGNVFLFTNESNFTPDFVINNNNFYERSGSFTFRALLSRLDENGSCLNNVIEFADSAPLTLVDTVSFTAPLRLELR